MDATLKAMVRRKFDYAFRCLDLDDSGTLDRDDIVRLAEALCDGSGRDPGDEASATVRRTLLDAWELLLSFIDADDSGDIDRAEITQLQALMVDETEMFGGHAPPWLLDAAIAVFRALDIDGDGQISLDEYCIYLGAIGSRMDAVQAFSRLDLDDSGYIEIDELESLVVQFLTSRNMEDPGNYLMTGGWPSD